MNKRWEMPPACFCKTQLSLKAPERHSCRGPLAVMIERQGQKTKEAKKVTAEEGSYRRRRELMEASGCMGREDGYVVLPGFVLVENLIPGPRLALYSRWIGAIRLSLVG